MTASGKGSYYNQELLVNEYETCAIEEHRKSSSKFNMHKETVDKSQNESDATSKSENDIEEETEN